MQHWTPDITEAYRTLGFRADTTQDDHVELPLLGTDLSSTESHSTSDDQIVQEWIASVEAELKRAEEGRSTASFKLLSEQSQVNPNDFQFQSTQPLSHAAAVQLEEFGQNDLHFLSMQHLSHAGAQPEFDQNDLQFQSAQPFLHAGAAQPEFGQNNLRFQSAQPFLHVAAAHDQINHFTQPSSSAAQSTRSGVPSNQKHLYLFFSPPSELVTKVVAYVNANRPSSSSRHSASSRPSQIPTRKELIKLIRTAATVLDGRGLVVQTLFPPVSEDLVILISEINTACGFNRHIGTSLPNNTFLPDLQSIYNAVSENRTRLTKHFLTATSKIVDDHHQPPASDPSATPKEIEEVSQSYWGSLLHEHMFLHAERLYSHSTAPRCTSPALKQCIIQMAQIYKDHVGDCFSLNTESECLHLAANAACLIGFRCHERFKNHPIKFTDEQSDHLLNILEGLQSNLQHPSYGLPLRQLLQDVRMQFSDEKPATWGTVNLYFD